MESAAIITTPNDKEEGEEEGPRLDRVSELSDSIIQHILSFLDDTKSVVQTSILSKRWRHIWKCVPTLLFDNHSFPDTDAFDGFVRHVLSRRDTRCQVRHLRFFRRTQLDKSLAKRVIGYAVSRGVSRISISLYGHGKVTGKSSSRGRSIPLSRLLVTCRTLQTLTIAGVVRLRLLPYPRTLTALHLKNCVVKCFPEDTAPTFDGFAAMVNLKELCIEECAFFNLDTLLISGPELQNLTLLNVGQSYERRLIRWFGLGIVAPKLKTLTFRCQLPRYFSQLHLPSLQHANVYVVRPPFGVDTNDEPTSSKVLKLVQGLCNAQSLQLGATTIQKLAAFPQLLEQQSSPFTRLESLELEVRPHNKVYQLALPVELVAYFLQGSPSAEVKILGSWSSGGILKGPLSLGHS